MKHSLLSLGLRTGVVGSVLVLGWTQGDHPGTPGPVPALGGAVPPGKVLRAPAAPTAGAPARRPEIRILEVLPAGGVTAEQEAVSRGEGPEENAPAPYGHAPDYHWLTGELHYSPARGAWWVHYAAADEEDRHGGSVTLVGAGTRAGLRNGQAVRVEGEMIDPEAREPRPPYRVRRLRPLVRG